MATALEKALLDATRQTTLTDDSLPSVLQMYNKDINIPQLAITLALHCHFERLPSISTSTNAIRQRARAMSIMT